MGKSKKQQLAEELGRGMTAIVSIDHQEPTDDGTRHYDVLENELERDRNELKKTLKRSVGSK